MKKSNATLILVLGILSLVCCGLLAGIPGIIMGNNTLKEMDAGQMESHDRNLANIGRILAIIGTILSVIGTILYFTVFATVAGAAVAAGA